jgi:hypothetical protein
MFVYNKKMKVHTVKIVSAPQITFTVDVSRIIEDVDAGKYNDKPNFLCCSPSPNKGNNIVSFQRKQQISKTSNDQDDVYYNTTITGEKVNIVSTGVDAFSGKKGGECFYCRYPYTDEGFGYCISIDYTGKEPIFYDQDRCMCSDKCVWAYMNYIHIPQSSKEKYMTYTEAMFRHIYGENYIPVKARDFRLLVKNHGTESYEEWSKPTNNYKEIRGINIVPIKKIYTLQDTTR